VGAIVDRIVERQFDMNADFVVRLTMESIKLKSHVGDDGVLQIQIPVGFKNEDLEVMVIFQRLKSRDRNSATLESRGWQPGFFEEVIGSWEGEPLERPEQLPYETREELTFGEDVS
jgi:hypothetical protein